MKNPLKLDKLLKRSGTIAIGATVICAMTASTAIAAPLNISAAKTTSNTSPATLEAYTKVLHDRVLHAWHLAKSPHTYSNIRFRVTKAGRIFWVELTDASKVDAVNFAAEDALASCVLPPMPKGSPEFVDFTAEFESEFAAVNSEGYSRPLANNRTASLKLLQESTQLSKDGKHDKAVEQLKKALDLNPFDSRIRDALASEYAKLSKQQTGEAAIHSLRLSIILDTENQSVRQELNRLLGLSGVNAASFDARLQLARGFSQTGAFEDAVVEFGEAWLLSKDSKLIPQINKCLAQFKESTSVRKWQAAVAANGSMDSHLALAKAYESCGLMEKAKAEFALVDTMRNESDKAAILTSASSKATQNNSDEEEEEEEDATSSLASSKRTNATKQDADQSDEQETTTVSMGIAPQPNSVAVTAPTGAPSVVPSAAGESETTFRDDFPYVRSGTRSLKLAILKNRAVLQDYLTEACKDKTIRWASNRIPLSLYIDPGNNVPGYRPQFRQYMLEAFDAWQKASGKRLRYKLVGGPLGANIVCHWTANPADQRMHGSEQGITYFKYLQSSPNGGLVQSAEITILVKGRFTGQVLSDAEMRGVCLHELGHSFGINGHSPSKSDIMFPFMTKVSSLSQADQNTITRLYQGYEHPRD